MTKKIIIITVGVLCLGVLVYLFAPVDRQASERARESDAGLPVAGVESHAQADRVAIQEAENAAPRRPHAPVHSTLPLEPKIRQALGEILNTSSEGLVLETRNGVTSVDLQGRFQTAPVAVIDENGDIHITDYIYMPREEHDQ